MERFVRAVRDACPSGLWARGVKLARADKVTLESEDEGEIVLRVEAGGRRPAPTVILYVGDRDWECDCDGRFDACEHVAAATLVVSRARERGAEVTRADPAGAGKILYRLERRPGQLWLTREVAGAGGERTTLRRSVHALLAERSGPRLDPDRIDLEVDRVLGPNPPQVVTGRLAPRLLAALAGCPRITLDGEPVAASAEPLLPRARLSRRGAELSLRVAADSRVEAIVAPGVALAGGELRALAATELTGAGLERLPLVRRFTGAEVAELVGEALPALEREIDVQIDPDVELPGLATAEPRLDLGLRRRRGGGLRLLPRIVYGRPACARVDGDRLVFLRGEVPRRDRGAERRLTRQLRDELDLQCGRELLLEAGEAAELLEKLSRSALATPDDAAAAVPLSPELVETEAGVAVRFTAAGGGVASADEVLGAFAAGVTVVPLSDGGFGEIPIDWLDDRGALVAALARVEGGAGAVGAAAALAEDLGAGLPRSLEALRPLVEGFTALPEPELPADLAAELRGYQRRGTGWLQFLRGAGLGAVLADDMGLGKTVQLLASLRAGRPSLVVCPTSVLSNWAREAARFRPGLRVCVYHGSGRELDGEADLVLTSYGTLRRDIDRLAAVTWDTVALDEAQAIKNPDSQAARAAYRLEAAFRVAMSGTPVENRTAELWSLCHFTNPGLLGSRGDFDRDLGKPIAGGDGRALQRLQTLVRPVILRRTKSEVATELPPRTEVLERVELAEREIEIYQSVRAAARADVMRRLEGGGNPLSALTALLRLRQAACHAALLPDIEAESSSKIERLLELVDEVAAEGHKALIFSQWTSLLDLVEPGLARAGIEWVRLDGATRDRGAVVDRFQSDEQVSAMLISLKAGGTGLNLTAADHVFLIDPWWNPAVEEQAADRAHRIGQTRPVVVHRLVAADTVEERVLDLQERKRQLAGALVGSAVGAAAPLTRDDLMALLA